MNVAYDITKIDYSVPLAPDGGEGGNQNDRISGLLAAWKSSADYKRLEAKLQDTTPSRFAAANKNRFQQEFVTQFSILCKRAWKNVLRDPMLFKARMGQIIVIGAIVAIVFYDIPSKSEDAQFQVFLAHSPPRFSSLTYVEFRIERVAYSFSLQTRLSAPLLVL
jgi:hypothetical protein